MNKDHTDFILRGSIPSNEVENKERYCIEVSNRFAALEDLDAEVETIRVSKLHPKRA
jgi:hypothetical protein